METMGKDKAKQDWESGWRNVQKLRKSMQNDFNAIIKSKDPSNDEESGRLYQHFDALESALEHCRLHCVGLNWGDLRHAADLKVDYTLWLTHSTVNDAYRAILHRLSSKSRGGAKQKLTKRYETFLKISRSFYRGYIERTGARYGMRQLEKVAQRVKLKVMDVPAVEKVDAAAAQLETLVDESVQWTLICLGDLARYRAQLTTPASSVSESAMQYYSLADELIPDRGYAQHQMAVIRLRATKNPLDGMYHFYRALGVADPHPKAAENIEVLFTNIRRDDPPKSQSRQDALRNWFARLHAYLYCGEEFSAHLELEQEVISRFEAALGDVAMAETLLKMLVINVCAYDSAKARFVADQPPCAERARDSFLRLNVRTLTVIARLFNSKVRDYLASVTPEDRQAQPNDEQQTQSSGRCGQATQESLPFLRLYLAWLCAHSTDIVESESALDHHVVEMGEALAETLSLSQRLLSILTSLMTIDYLLPEDVHIRSLTALDCRHLPLSCQLNISKVTKEPKLHLQDRDASRSDTENEDVTRLFEVLLYGMYLVDDVPSFPLTKRADDGSGAMFWRSQFVYLAESKPQPVSCHATKCQSVDIKRKDASHSLGDMPTSPALTANSGSRVSVESPLAAEEQLNTMLGGLLDPPSGEWLNHSQLTQMLPQVRSPTVDGFPPGSNAKFANGLESIWSNTPKYQASGFASPSALQSSFGSPFASLLTVPMSQNISTHYGSGNSPATSVVCRVSRVEDGFRLGAGDFKASLAFNRSDKLTASTYKETLNVWEEAEHCRLARMLSGQAQKTAGQKEPQHPLMTAWSDPKPPPPTSVGLSGLPPLVPDRVAPMPGADLQSSRPSLGLGNARLANLRSAQHHAQLYKTLRAMSVPETEVNSLGRLGTPR